MTRFFILLLFLLQVLTNLTYARCAKFGESGIVHNNDLGVPSVSLEYDFSKGSQVCVQGFIQECQSNGLWRGLDEPCIGDEEEPDQEDSKTLDPFSDEEDGYQNNDSLNEDLHNARTETQDWSNSYDPSSESLSPHHHPSTTSGYNNFPSNNTRQPRLNCQQAVQKYCDTTFPTSEPKGSFCIVAPTYIQQLKQGIRINQNCSSQLRRQQYFDCSVKLDAQVRELQRYLQGAQQSYRGRCK